jgi:hypothetical protein
MNWLKVNLEWTWSYLRMNWELINNELLVNYESCMNICMNEPDS